MSRRRFPIAAAAVLGILIVATLAAPLIARHSPSTIVLAERLQSPDVSHWMGTDELGRDVFSRMLFGGRTSLLVGFAAGILALAIGSLLGAVAGAFGSWVDWLISRLIEVVLAFPFLVLLLVIVALVGPSVWSIIGALAVTGWVSEARFVRGEVIKLRELEFVHAARATGAGPFRTMFRHLLPGALPPAIVSAAFGVAGAILVESALSFLGFGVQLPRTSWGAILASGRQTIGVAWWLVLFPGLAIFMTVASIHQIAQWLEDRLGRPGR